MGRSVRIELELELDADTIAGTLSSPDTPSHPFDGWLELASAIEQLRTTATRASRPGSVKPATHPASGDPPPDNTRFAARHQSVNSPGRFRLAGAHHLKRAQADRASGRRGQIAPHNSTSPTEPHQGGQLNGRLNLSKHAPPAAAPRAGRHSCG